jgi:GT2 family glycosyltransferase
MNVESLLTISIVAAVAYLAIVATLAIVAALRAGGRRDDASEDHDALAVSRFTIPVSIIVTVSRRSAALSRAVSTLLELNYPEFEVIVVADGTSEIVIDTLGRDWQLEAREFFYRKTIETSDVRRIYRSGRDSRLMVIDKAAAGASDALNCGVNVARYRYVMSVAPEVIFDRDALLRVMTAALRDPANVVGASNHIERGAYPSVASPAYPVQGAPPSTGLARLTALFQRLASARSLMDSRLAWRVLGAGFSPTDAVITWRRDAVIKLGGFSATAADPDLDMLFRLQTQGGDAGGRFTRGMDVFGRVGPQPMQRALRTSGRRQVAALGILAASLRGRARRLEGRTLAYFFQSEIVTPLAEIWIVLATLAGAGVGWYSWTAVLLALLVLSLGNAAVSNAALLLRGSSAGAPDEPELRQLLAAGPFEFLVYRPALAAARVAATISFLGIK